MQSTRMNNLFCLSSKKLFVKTTANIKFFYV